MVHTSLSTGILKSLRFIVLACRMLYFDYEESQVRNLHRLRDGSLFENPIHKKTNTNHSNRDIDNEAGVELKKYGFSNFYGADLSQKLLDLVPKGLYKKLEKVDLNKSIEAEDNVYDAVMCVGTFTFGHVKPPALEEFIRITKNKGLICFTINEGIHEEYGFNKKIDQLNKENKWKEIELSLIHI